MANIVGRFTHRYCALERSFLTSDFLELRHGFGENDPRLVLCGPVSAAARHGRLTCCTVWLHGVGVTSQIRPVVIRVCLKRAWPRVAPCVPRR